MFDHERRPSCEYCGVVLTYGPFRYGPEGAPLCHRCYLHDVCEGDAELMNSGALIGSPGDCHVISLWFNWSV